MSEFSMNMNESVGACFAWVAARLPAKTAIECDGGKISYAELDIAANAVARRLLAGDVRPPARVALLFNDRIASITAMLGVLKAGDAYVPLDADDPDERVQFVLRDCAPYALITDSVNLERARALISGSCLLVNIDETEFDGISAPLPAVGPDALAYLFYTSGSTGQPKGVCHSHRNLLYFIGRYSVATGICEDDRLSLLYSLSFSAANMDIYGGLLNGASVHAYDVRRNGILPLAEWLVREGITILHAVPTVFRHLTGGLNLSHRFEGIRAIDLGGETVFASDVTLFRRHFRKDCRLINHLAATEVMVMAQYIVHPSDPYEGVQTLPAGRSPDGVRLHIQRPDGVEADAGEVGEIVVSSSYVSSGYWQRPELNAAVFADDPENPGWRIYRTGDCGRIAADGNLHFLGRNGTRVKIRGQSVDLAEVEAGLRQCTSVRDAAVITGSRNDLQEVDRLVAYVVVGAEADRDPGRIRRELAQRLPLYMLPSRYIFLDALPLTATGKVNREALPSAGDLSGCENEDCQPPMEKLLADTRKDVPGFDESRIHDIEATLLQHPTVLGAVAQARDVDAGGKIWVAFIAGKQDASLTLQELRDFLGRSLPAYLIPGRIFLVSSLPLDANGKPDRAALQNVPLPKNEMQTSRRMPYNALQATLLQIWSGLLENAEIGINENFFELGGDSHLAIIMLYQIEKLTKWSVPLATIYNNPTVESLAQAMLEHRGKDHSSPLIEIQAGVSKPPFFFMHGDFHGGGHYCYQLARFMGPDQAFYAIQPHGLPGRPLPTTIEEMAAEYLALIRTACPQGPYFLGGHCNGAMVAFEIAQRLLEEGSEVGLLVMMDPFPVRGQGSYLIAKAGEGNATENTDLDKLSPVARHNAVMQLHGNVCRNYEPTFYRGKMALFMAKDSPRISDPAQGWRSMAAKGEIHVVPGNHVSMLTVHAPVIAKKLVECRNKVKWD